MATNNTTNNFPDCIKQFILLPDIAGAISTAKLLGGANRVYNIPIILNSSILVKSISFEIVALEDSKLASVGIYSLDGNTLLVDSGPISTTTAGVKTTTLGTPVFLASGSYRLSWTGNSNTTFTFRTSATATATNYIFNAITTRYGRTANDSTNGQLPATTGAITDLSIVAIPFVLLSAE